MKLYGVHIMHPVTAMVPGAADGMPHKTNDEIVFFQRKQDAVLATELFAKQYKVRATSIPFGHDGKGKIQLTGVGVIYQAVCPEGKELRADVLAGAPVYRGTLEGMHIENIEVRIQNDPLHGPLHKEQSTSFPFSLAEISSEMAARWSDYQELDKALRNSTPEQLQRLDFNDLNQLASLQLMYGTAGRINENFFNSHPNADHLMSIERVMHKGQVGIGYITHLLEMENKYQDTYHTLTNEGYSGEYAAAVAAKQMAQTLQTLSKLYNDAQAHDGTFAPLVEAYNLETPNSDREDGILVEPTEDEQDIFV